MDEFLSSVLSLALVSNSFARYSETDKKLTKMMIFQKSILVKLVTFFIQYFLVLIIVLSALF